MQLIRGWSEFEGPSLDSLCALTILQPNRLSPKTLEKILGTSQIFYHANMSELLHGQITNSRVYKLPTPFCVHTVAWGKKDAVLLILSSYPRAKDSVNFQVRPLDTLMTLSRRKQDGFMDREFQSKRGLSQKATLLVCISL